jgi:hypothetical protein
MRSAKTVAFVAASVATAVASSFVGGTNWNVLSTADA